MNLIAPILLIIASVGIFFGYIDPNYKGNNFVEGKYLTYGVKQLNEEAAQYAKTESDSTQVKAKRDMLLEKNTKITTADQEKLKKFLPDNVDNVKLIVEATDMAEKKALIIKSISLGSNLKKSQDIAAVDNEPYGTVSLKFNVVSTYDNFLKFLQDMEQNLRLADVTEISFNSTDSGFYEFSFTINTYWLK